MKEQGIEDSLPDFPVFKGLQRPLEFMGLQGRYIFWAAGAVGGAIVGFIIVYLLLGFIAGLIVMASIAGAGSVLILAKQKRGLHSKKIDKGVFVYAYSCKL